MSEPFEERPLAELRELGGEALVAQVVGMFQRSAPGRVQAARAAFLAGDLGAVVKPVHALVTSAGNVGAARLRDLSRETEAAARSGDRARVGKLLDALEDALAEAMSRFGAL